MSTKIWDVSHEAYHADRSKIGSSMLSALAKSPELFKFRYIDGIEKPGGPSAAMKLGTAVHDKVLLDKDPGKLPTGAQWQYDNIIRSWEKCWRWRPLIEVPDDALHKVETGFVREWEGVEWKCKPDLLRFAEGQEEILLVDLKTTSDASCDKFSKSIEDFNYYRQAAHYCWVLEPWLLAEYGLTYKINVLFLCFHTAEPFEIRLHQLDPRWLRDGQHSCEFLRADYLERSRNQDWESTDAHDIQTCIRPAWAGR